MKITFILIFIIICGISVYPQNNPTSGNVRNNKPQIILSDTARYEIVFLSQIPLTVKLDRYTGKTYQYFNEKRKWYLLEVRGGLPSAAANLTPTYQICDDGEFNILINNETGQSWVFNVRNWEPVTD
jgi:hypothetical protein